MAETGGRALRVYHVLLILGLGWAIGRLPDMVRAAGTEEQLLRQAVAGNGSAETETGGTLLTEERVAAIAASVAAQVAAEAADATLARLMAAGWGPQQYAGAPQVKAAQPPIVIRHIVSQSPPARPQEVAQPAAWTLQPSALQTVPPALDTGRPATAAAAVASPATPAAHAIASQGYAALKEGDRRRAAGLLAAALAEAPDSPQAAGWAADLRQLRRRWSAEAYVLSRGAGNSDPLAAQPILGGGQSGAAVHYTLNPLSRTRIGLFGRVAAAAGPSGVQDPDTVEAAAGVRIRPTDRLPVALDVERRFAVGPLARSTWAARLSAGDTVPVAIGGVRGQVDVYAETGIVGFGRPDLYAGAQARAGTGLVSTSKVSIDVGAGAWGGWQESGNVATSRLDVGPSLRLRLKPFPFAAQLDYRLRTLGEADPGSGPVVTLAGSF